MWAKRNLSDPRGYPYRLVSGMDSIYIHTAWKLQFLAEIGVKAKMTFTNVFW